MASFHLLKDHDIQTRKRTTTKYLKQKQNRKNQSESEDPEPEEHYEIKEHFEYRTSLNKTPQLLELTGPLSRINSSAVFDKVNCELIEIQKRSGNDQLVPYIEAKFEQMKGKQQDDLAVMELVMGYNRVACLTMKVDKLPVYFERLKQTIKGRNVRHLNVIECMINFPLFQKNLFQKKYGKAYKCAVASTAHVQNVAPNAWTAIAYDIRAKMYEIHAQVAPQAKDKHLKSALDCYRIAREHVLIQPCQDDQNCVLKIIFLTLQMTFLALKLPCLSTVNILGNKNIVNEPLSSCTLSTADLEDAESMLDTVKKQLQPMEPTGYAYRLKEEMAICDICTEIRRAQLMVKSSNYRPALDAIIKAEQMYNKWDNSYSKDNISQNVKSPVLKTELSALVQTIKAQVLLMLQEASTACTHIEQREGVTLSNITKDKQPFEDMENTQDNKTSAHVASSNHGFTGYQDSGTSKDSSGQQASAGNQVASSLKIDALSFGDDEKDIISSSDVNEVSSNFESQDSDVLEGY